MDWTASITWVCSEHIWSDLTGWNQCGKCTYYIIILKFDIIFFPTNTLISLFEIKIEINKCRSVTDIYRGCDLKWRQNLYSCDIACVLLLCRLNFHYWTTHYQWGSEVWLKLLNNKDQHQCRWCLVIVTCLLTLSHLMLGCKIVIL